MPMTEPGGQDVASAGHERLRGQTMAHGMDDATGLAPNPYKTRTGFDRIAHAAVNSVNGMRQAWITESAFRQELVLAAVMVPLGLWLGDGWAERMALAGSVLLVLIVELLNTAVEYTVDRVSLERNPLSKTAKDLGSAAVLLTLLLCAMVWAAVLLPRWL